MTILKLPDGVLLVVATFTVELTPGFTVLEEKLTVIVLLGGFNAALKLTASAKPFNAWILTVKLTDPPAETFWEAGLTAREKSTAGVPPVFFTLRIALFSVSAMKREPAAST